MQSKHSTGKVKRTYEKPVLKVIELEARDVLAFCNQSSSDAAQGACPAGCPQP